VSAIGRFQSLRPSEINWQPPTFTTDSVLSRRRDLTKLHRSQFLKEITESWPELRTEINREEGLLHLEMAVVCRFAQQLIDSGRREDLNRCFEIVEKYVGHGNAKMRDAIDVSFVEMLNFSDSKKCEREWAWEVFPSPLKELYIQFHGRSGID
jgi:hypothetical protein